MAIKEFFFDIIDAFFFRTIHGFIADTLSLEIIINQDPNCSLSLMGRDFFTVPVGFLFRKNWPWAEKFKLMQLRMNEDKRIEDEWKMKRRQSSCQTRRSDIHTRLSVADMSGVFLILIFTFAYCCFCLFFENTYQLLKHYYVNFKKSWNIPQRARQVKHNATNVDWKLNFSFGNSLFKLLVHICLEYFIKYIKTSCRSSWQKNPFRHDLFLRDDKHWKMQHEGVSGGFKSIKLHWGKIY